MSDSERLDKVVAFRITDLDFIKYRRKFEAAGLTQSKFFRKYVLRNATEVKPFDRKYILQLASIGNNMNQIAHRLNGDHVAGKVNTETYKAMLYKLDIISRDMSELLELAKNHVEQG